MVPGRYILHRVGSRAKSNGRKVMFGYPSWYMLLCGDDAHTIGIRIVVGKVCKLCRVKSIRIAASAVMDELKWPYLTGASFVLERLYKEKEKVVFGVPEGYGES